MKVDRAFNILGRIAEDLDASVFSSNSARIASMIVFRDRIISIGVNSKKTHPIQLKFGDYPYLHAESEAIVKAKNRGLDLTKAEIFIYRAKWENDKKKNWTQGMSKPCESCLSLLKNYRLKRVVFSLDNEGYGVID